MAEDKETYMYGKDVADAIDEDVLTEVVEAAKSETVTIPLIEYQTLNSKANWLSCLEVAGVDNWDGIIQAQEIFKVFHKKGKPDAE